MYVRSICSFVFCFFSLQLFVSESVKMVALALLPTRVNASRVTLASGVKPVCTGQARFIALDNFVY